MWCDMMHCYIKLCYMIWRSVMWCDVTLYWAPWWNVLAYVSRTRMRRRAEISIQRWSRSRPLTQSGRWQHSWWRWRWSTREARSVCSHCWRTLARIALSPCWRSRSQEVAVEWDPTYHTLKPFIWFNKEEGRRKEKKRRQVQEENGIVRKGKELVLRGTDQTSRYAHHSRSGDRETKEERTTWVRDS